MCRFRHIVDIQYNIGRRGIIPPIANIRYIPGRKVEKDYEYNGECRADKPKETNLSAVISVKHFGHCTLLRGVHGREESGEMECEKGDKRWRRRRGGGRGAGKRREGRRKREREVGRERGNIRHPGWLDRLCPTDDVHDQAPPTHMPPAIAHVVTRTPTHSYTHTYIHIHTRIRIRTRTHTHT